MSDNPPNAGTLPITHARKAVVLLTRAGSILHAEGSVDVFFECLEAGGEAVALAKAPLREPLSLALAVLSPVGELAPEHEVHAEERGQLYRVRFTATPVALPGAVEPVISLSLVADPIAPQEIFLPREYWRTLVETSPGLICLLDRSGAILFVNRAITRDSVGDVIGRQVHELLPSETVDIVMQALTRVFETGQSSRLVFPIPTASGDRWFEAQAGPVLEAGKVVSVILNALDVTEQWRVEAALRESEERFRLLFQRMRDAFVLLEAEYGDMGQVRDYRVLEANATAQEVTGIAAEAGLGRLLSEMVPDMDAGVWARLARALEEDEPARFEHYSQHFARHFEFVAYRPQPGRLAVMFADVSDRCRAENALRASEAKYRLLMETLQEGVIAVDLYGHTTFANARMGEMLGYQPAEMLGRHIESFVDPARTGRLNVLLHGMLEGRHAQYDLELTGRIGTAIQVTAETSPIRDDDGNVIGTLAGVIDVTARKRAEMEHKLIEAKMQQVRRLESLGTLAGNIALDFSDIMAATLDSAQHALAALADGAPARAFVERVLEEAGKASKLSQAMMAQAGLVAQTRSAIVLADLIREMEPLLRASVAPRGQLRLALAAEPIMLLADPAQLRQALTNLVINAGEALPDADGMVTVSTRVRACAPGDLQCRYLMEDWPEGDYAVIEVADNGCGMTPETLDRLFDPFFSTKGLGRGFGLSATLGFLRAHKGLVQVASEPGAGTTVSMLAPAYARKAAPAAPISDTAREKGILIVDDEESVVSVVSRMLIRRGFNVFTASSGQQALDVFRAESARIQVVILDIIMPDMDGEATLRALRELRPDLPALLSSGLSEGEVSARFGSYGNTAYVRKPYRAATLSERMDHLLGKGSE